MNNMRTYVITGATGHTGMPIAKGLLEKGHKVRVISRSAEKAAELKQLGAEVVVGNHSDTELLKKAFTGADAVYAMVPFEAMAPDYTAMQLSYVNAMATAIHTMGVKYAVTLSSIGAHLTTDAGLVKGLHEMEEAFNAIPGLNVRHMRAGYFMENTLAQVGAIKFMGVMASPVKGDLKVPMVSTGDIAAVGLKRLLDLDFSGKSHEYIMGQRDISYNEIAGIFGKAIGKPDLQYVAAPYDQAKQVMMQMGMGDSVTDRMMEFVKSMNDGLVLADAKRTPENTTPTSIEEFSYIFKAVFEQS
jgi:uncharacterized protein YbjT (DUF2867 family)